MSPAWMQKMISSTSWSRWRSFTFTFGSYPGNMPYCYFSDEEHIKEWLKVEENPEEFKKFLKLK